MSDLLTCGGVVARRTAFASVAEAMEVAVAAEVGLAPNFSALRLC